MYQSTHLLCRQFFMLHQDFVGRGKIILVGSFLRLCGLVNSELLLIIIKPTNILQIFCELMFNFQVIFKSTIGTYMYNMDTYLQVWNG